MDDPQILDRIRSMVETEHALRDQLAQGRITADEEQELLHAIEVELDQCWDLLRQRRARRDVREDPNTAAVRPPREVEGYEQ
ncbi:DUF2630 family protein [Yinghuangia sp. ASG 101]|uniref:DUF2630 family protein n=1 Tax=Yinghuangia sp. ASG 101 TaxID=2896848 RepID=UPI001E30E952|nr:DUF2630 family protein [Yinghuangia sp. ASG 101]UGQ13877.1 DUF2630 family protein [Yinghuangia sp. ASG 101]